LQVAVIGAGECGEEQLVLAKELGKQIAQAGHVLLTGGLGGVMEAVSEGAKEAGGITIGILPGEKETHNPYVDIPIATGMGHARNVILVRSADVVIALYGLYGTLSEIALALKMERKVIDLGGSNFAGTIKAQTPEEAVKLIEG